MDGKIEIPLAFYNFFHNILVLFITIIMFYSYLVCVCSRVVEAKLVSKYKG
jgi:hypothetical protein